MTLRPLPIGTKKNRMRRFRRFRHSPSDGRADRLPMKLRQYARAAVYVSSILCTSTTLAEPNNLWAHDNLVAWEAAPYDSIKRSPDERAQMFERLGIKH